MVLKQMDGFFPAWLQDFWEFGVVNDDQIRLGAPGEMRNHEVMQGKPGRWIYEINRWN